MWPSQGLFLRSLVCHQPLRYIGISSLTLLTHGLTYIFFIIYTIIRISCHFLLFFIVIACVDERKHTHPTVCVWKTEENFWGSSLSFHDGSGGSNSGGQDFMARLFTHSADILLVLKLLFLECSIIARHIIVVPVIGIFKIRATWGQAGRAQTGFREVAPLIITI